MLGLLLSFFFAGGFDIGEIYVELSMDTYPYGMDPSPLIKTVGNKHPKIDSMVDSRLYGRLGRRTLQWDSTGVCVSRNCRPSDNLTWSDLWVDKP
jgi:hypothetical protein